MSQVVVTSMANCDVITTAYRCLEPIGVIGLSWHIMYWRKIWTQTTATLELNTQWFKNPSLFAHCTGFFFMVEEKSTNKLHCNNASWMATRKQVSDTLKSIWPTKQMQIFLLYKNTRKYKYHCGSSLFDVFVFNKTELLQTTCLFFYL